MKDSIYVSKENYLKAILEAEAEGHQVIPAMLAHSFLALKTLRRKKNFWVDPAKDSA